MKTETLKTAIENLPDCYIEEALQPIKKKGHLRYKVLGLAAALALCLGTAFSLPRLGATEPYTEPYLPSLSVKVYAAEAGGAEEEGIILEKGIEASFSNWAPYMSFTPGMEFSFFYGDEEDVVFCATSDESGWLSKFDSADGFYWYESESGQSVTCKTGEHIYWNPNVLLAGKTVITVDVLSGGKTLDSKKIIITRNPDDMMHTAVLEDVN